MATAFGVLTAPRVGSGRTARVVANHQQQHAQHRNAKTADTVAASFADKPTRVSVAVS